MKLLKNPLVHFGLVILFFASVYWFFWSVFPDSFVKNDYLNSTPIENVSRVAFGVSPEIQDGRFFSQSDIANKSDDLVGKYNEIILRGVELNNNLVGASIKENALRKQNDALWSVNYENFIQDSVKGLHQDLIKLKAINKSEGQYDVAIAELNLEIALKIKEANDYAFNHLADFNDKKIWREILEKSALQDKLRIEIDKNEKQRMQLQTKAADFLSNRQRPDIRIWDFFYYSVGISTTTTFGDIMASSRGARAVVTFQLLISIFILAFATNNVIHRLQAKSH